MAIVNTGILTPKYLFTGHENGQVVAWEIESQTPKLICSLIRTIRNIRKFNDNLFIGGDGDILKVISLENIDETLTIKKNYQRFI